MISLVSHSCDRILLGRAASASENSLRAALVFLYFIKQRRRRRRSTSFLLKLFVTQNINYAVHRWIRRLPSESCDSGFADSVQKLCTLYFNVERAKVVPHLLASIIHYMCEREREIRHSERERESAAAFLFWISSACLFQPSPTAARIHTYFEIFHPSFAWISMQNAWKD